MGLVEQRLKCCNICSELVLIQEYLVIVYKALILRIITIVKPVMAVSVLAF